MRHRQRGMTFLGLVILISFIGIFVYAGMRLAPAYLEWFKVQKALSDLKRETEGASSPKYIEAALGKRFDIEDIPYERMKDIEITKAVGGWNVRCTYDADVPFLGNVSFLVHFDKTVNLTGG